MAKVLGDSFNEDNEDDDETEEIAEELVER